MGTAINFDLRPFPFQEEILDIIAAEREVQNKHRHLVVAATGTGKTMIAAFDYARVSQQLGRKPRLLFVAHRKEILNQALASFRCVVREQNFGDLLVDGNDPGQRDHLFCSIQSYNSRSLIDEAADRFEYIVVDEFHHAAAPSYQALLGHVQPTILLGLTATPERSDQLDVLSWFGGRASAEIRLPDAINRRLLCPFQYFGVADSVDLTGLAWQRGGYRVDDLDRLYTGNDIRAKLVLEKLCDTVLNLADVRGLAFCVSVAHAEFMARFFNDNGIPAIALSAQSNDLERNSAQQKLRDRTVNFIFVVDLYNEGIHHCCSYGRPRACPRACRHRITSSAHASTSITQAAGRLVSLGNCFTQYQLACSGRWLVKSRCRCFLSTELVLAVPSEVLGIGPQICA